MHAQLAQRRQSDDLCKSSSSGFGSLKSRVKSRIKCCIPGCNNREGDPGFSFHRFPTDPVMRNEWVSAINYSGFVPSLSTRICSRHFARHSFVAKPEGAPRHPASRRRLYPNAVPSIFSHNKSSIAVSIVSRSSTLSTPTKSGVNLVGGAIGIGRESVLHRNGGNLTQGLADNSHCDYAAFGLSTSSVSATSPAPSTLSASSGRKPEISLLSQIVRVAMDVDEGQAQLLRELNRLGRRQSHQEVLLAQLVERLTDLVETQPGSDLPPASLVKRSQSPECIELID